MPTKRFKVKTNLLVTLQMGHINKIVNRKILKKVVSKKKLAQIKKIVSAINLLTLKKTRFAAQQIYKQFKLVRYCGTCFLMFILFVILSFDTILNFMSSQTTAFQNRINNMRFLINQFEHNQIKQIQQPQMIEHIDQQFESNEIDDQSKSIESEAPLKVKKGRGRPRKHQI